MGTEGLHIEDWMNRLAYFLAAIVVQLEFQPSAWEAHQLD
jgi:hypothetical protein